MDIQISSISSTEVNEDNSLIVRSLDRNGSELKITFQGPAKSQAIAAILAHDPSTMTDAVPEEVLYPQSLTRFLQDNGTAGIVFRLNEKVGISLAFRPEGLVALQKLLSDLIHLMGHENKSGEAH